MPRLAASLPVGEALADAVELAAKAESLGYDSVWVSQLADARDAALVLSAYAGVTSRVRLGTSVIPIHARHPCVMLQVAATLDEISGGRFVLGLGAGHESVVTGMWRVGYAPAVPAMRDYVTILRTLLANGMVEYEGRHFSALCAYSGQRRADLPIIVGAVNPRLLRLAGEIAEGVSLWLCPPDYIRTVVIPAVEAGRAASGRSLAGFEVIAHVPAALVDPSGRAAASLAFSRSLLRYSRLPAYGRALAGAGFAEELGQGRVSERMVSALAGIGDRDGILQAVARYRDAGCTLPMLSPIEGYAQSFSEVLEAAAGA